jgi:hypothetical protein
VQPAPSHGHRVEGGEVLTNELPGGRQTGSDVHDVPAEVSEEVPQAAALSVAAKKVQPLEATRLNITTRGLLRLTTDTEFGERLLKGTRTGWRGCALRRGTPNLLRPCNHLLRRRLTLRDRDRHARDTGTGRPLRRHPLALRGGLLLRNGPALGERI